MTPLALAVMLCVSQSAPPLPGTTRPGFRIVEVRQDTLATVLALDAQLRRPGATWAAPTVGVSLAIAALSIGGSVLGLVTHATGAAILFEVLGLLVGTAATGIATVVGFVGWGDALRRAELQTRRDRLLDSMEPGPRPPPGMVDVDR